MPQQHISSFSNQAVKSARALREKKHRKREGQFLVEGLRLMTEAREAGYIPQSVFMSANHDPHPLIPPILAQLEAAGGMIYTTSDEILRKISGKDNPQAIIGIYNDLPYGLDRLDRSQADIWLVVQQMRDPGNLGTIMRTGDAIGAGGVILIDQCTDPFSVEAVRASMGAIFIQSLAQASWAEFIDWLRAGEGQLVAASLGSSLDYQAAHYQRPCFLLIGNEARGLPDQYEQACDIRVKIPMRGKADSLNAAMACAVMGYEILNQHRSGG